MILSFLRLILSVFALVSLCALGSPIINSSEEVEGALKALMSLNQSREEVLNQLQAHLQTSASSLQEQITLNIEEQKEHQEQIKKLVLFMLEMYSTVSEDVIEIAKQIARHEFKNRYYLINVLNEKIINKDARQNSTIEVIDNKNELTQDDRDVLIEFLKNTQDPEFVGRQVEDLTYKDFSIIMYKYLEYSNERFELLRKKGVPKGLLLKIAYFKYPIEDYYGMLSISTFLDRIKLGSAIDDLILKVGTEDNDQKRDYSVREIFSKIKSSELYLKLSTRDKINLELIEESLHNNGKKLSSEELFRVIPYLSRTE